MITVIAIAEAVAATSAFGLLARFHARARSALRHANWRADTYASMLDRRERRAGGAIQRDDKGRFA